MDPVTSSLENLAAAITALAATEPVERARQAKALIDRSKAALSQARRAAIAEALRGGRTYGQLAAELGVSAAAINAAVTAHVANGGSAPSGRSGRQHVRIPQNSESGLQPPGRPAPGPDLDSLLTDRPPQPLDDAGPAAGARASRRAGAAGGGVRERLVSAAAEVFAVSGYHASRVSDIVARAGVAQGTFYLYFRSKEAIFLELVGRYFAQILAEDLGAHDPRDAATPQDVVAQVRAMWKAEILRSREQPALVTAIMRDAPSLGPAARDLLLGYYERIADGVAAYATAALERGLMRRLDPRLAGWVLTGLAERAMYYAVAIDPEADTDWLADQLTTIEGGGVLTHWDDAWLTPRAPEGERPR